MTSPYIYYFSGVSNPEHAITINSGRYIIADTGNNRIIELDSTLTSIMKNYSIGDPVFVDYSEENETLLITSRTLNIIREVTWSDIDYGTLIWQSTMSMNGPQCATYKDDDTNYLVIADTGNNRIITYDRINDYYSAMDHYLINGVPAIDEISNFYRPYRVFWFRNGHIDVVEGSGIPIDFHTIESSSSSSSSKSVSSSSSSTEIRSSSSSSTSSNSSSTSSNSSSTSSASSPSSESSSTSSASSPSSESSSTSSQSSPSSESTESSSSSPSSQSESSSSSPSSESSSSSGSSMSESSSSSESESSSSSSTGSSASSMSESSSSYDDCPNTIVSFNASIIVII